MGRTNKPICIVRVYFNFLECHSLFNYLITNVCVCFSIFFLIFFSQIGDSRPQYVYHNGHQQQSFAPAPNGSMPRPQPRPQQYNNNVQGGIFQSNVDEVHQQKEGSPATDSGCGSETKTSLTKIQGMYSYFLNIILRVSA